MRTATLLLLALATGCAETDLPAPTTPHDETQARVGCEVSRIELVEDTSVAPEGFEVSADEALFPACGEFTGWVDLAHGRATAATLHTARGHEVRALHFEWVDAAGGRMESEACPPAYQLDFAGSLSASHALDEVFTSVLHTSGSDDPHFRSGLPLAEVHGDLAPRDLDPAAWERFELVLEGRLDGQRWDGSLTWVGSTGEDRAEEPAGDFSFVADDDD